MWETISLACGWTYFALGAISLYPQLFLNYQRKSVKGLSFDFLSVSFWGYFAYSVFNLAFFYSDNVRNEYRERFHSDNIVQLNDVFFALQACIVTGLTGLQGMLYRKSSETKISVWAWMFIWTTLYGSILLIFEIYTGGSSSWLDVVYHFSYIKIIGTVVKYIPQVYLNYRRQKTTGWSALSVLLDFATATLSVIQIIIDSLLQGGLQGIFGNPVKILLGLVSIIFDVIFIVQHYIWYRKNNKAEEVFMEEVQFNKQHT